MKRRRTDTTDTMSTQQDPSPPCPPVLEISKDVFYSRRTTRIQRRVKDVQPVSLEGVEGDTEHDGDLDNSDGDPEFVPVRISDTTESVLRATSPCLSKQPENNILGSAALPGPDGPGTLSNAPASCPCPHSHIASSSAVESELFSEDGDSDSNSDSDISDRHCGLLRDDSDSNSDSDTGDRHCGLLCDDSDSYSDSDTDESLFGLLCDDSDSSTERHFRSLSDGNDSDIGDRHCGLLFDNSDTGSGMSKGEDGNLNSQAPVSEPSASFVWSDGSGFVPELHPFQHGKSGVTEDWPFDDRARECDHFRAFLDEEVMSFIAEKTNEHHHWESEQLNNSSPSTQVEKWQDTTSSELYVMIALMFLMPLCKVPDLQDYWQDRPPLFISKFKKIMSGDRFSLLLKFLHFGDNENRNSHDRIWDVREIFSMFNSRFRKYYYPSQKLVIDEPLMLFKDRFSYKKHIPEDRHHSGTKLLVLTDCRTRIVLDIIVYKGTTIDMPNVCKNDPLGMSGAAIKKMMTPYMGNGHILYTDDCYTSPVLCQFLHDNKTGSCGAVKPNEKFMPKFDGPSTSDTPDSASGHNKRCKNQQKKNEVFIQKEKGGKILAIKYNGKRTVHLLSTVHKGELVNTGRHHSRTKPDAVVDFENHLQPIDKYDECCLMLSTTECLRKSVKWHHHLFLFLLDITMLNAYRMWMLTHGIHPSMEQEVYKFQRRVAYQLLKDYMAPISTSRKRRNAFQRGRLVGNHFPKK